MSRLKVFDDLMEDKLLNLHTAYIAKVISFNGLEATVQPLGMTKQYGKPAEKQALVSNVPVIQSARNKLSTKEITYVYNSSGATKTETIVMLTPLSVGDLVFCVCAERDITNAKKGNIATPQLGHHSLSDTVVVGIL